MTPIPGLKRNEPITRQQTCRSIAVSAGNPAVSPVSLCCARSEALRPRLTTGLPLNETSKHCPPTHKQTSLPTDTETTYPSRKKCVGQC